MAIILITSFTFLVSFPCFAMMPTQSPSNAIVDYMLSTQPKARLEKGSLTADPFSFTDDEIEAMLLELNQLPIARQAEIAGQEFRHKSATVFLQDLIAGRVPYADFDLRAIDRFEMEFERLLEQLRKSDSRHLMFRAEQSALHALGLSTFDSLTSGQNHNLRIQWQRLKETEFLRFQNSESGTLVNRNLIEQWRSSQLTLLHRLLAASVQTILRLRMVGMKEEYQIIPIEPGQLLSGEDRGLEWPQLKIEHLNTMQLTYQTLPDVIPHQKGRLIPVAFEWLLHDQNGKNFGILKRHSVYVSKTINGDLFVLGFKDADFNIGSLFFDFQKALNLEHMIWANRIGSHLIASIHSLINALQRINHQTSRRNLESQLRQAIYEIRKGGPTVEQIESSQKQRSIDKLLALLNDWHWWGWSRNENYWEIRENKAAGLRLPVFHWKGSRLDSSDSLREGERDKSVPAISSNHMANTQPPRGDAFSISSSLFGYLPPKYFILTPVTSTEPHEEIILASKNADITVSSLLPSETAKGYFPIPTPYGFEPVFLRVRKQKTSESPCLGVKVFKTVDGYWGAVNSNEPEVFFEAGFRKTNSESKATPAELQAMNDLDRQGLEKLANKLRQSSLRTLSKALDHKLIFEKPFSIYDLSTLVNKNSLYSYFPTEERKDDSHPFGRFDPFLNENGTLCFQCNGAAELLRDFLDEIWSGKYELIAKRSRVMVNVHGKLPLDTHAIVEVRSFDGRSLALIDGTPHVRDPRAPEAQSRLRQSLPNSVEPTSDDWFELRLKQLESAQQALLVKGEAIADRRFQMDSESPLVRANQIANTILAWSNGSVSFQQLLERNNCRSFDDLLTLIDAVKIAADLRIEDVPTTLSRQKREQRDFYRALHADIYKILSSSRQIFEIMQKKECDFLLNSTPPSEDDAVRAGHSSRRLNFRMLLRRKSRFLKSI